MSMCCIVDILQTIVFGFQSKMQADVKVLYC